VIIRARTLFFLGLCVSMLTQTTATLAAELRDPGTGLKMSLDIPGALLCVSIPARLRDAAACKGLPAPGESFQPNVIMAGIARFPTGGVIYTVVSQRKQSPGAMSRADAKEYVESALEGAKEQFAHANLVELRPGVTIDTQVVNGLQMFHFLIADSSKDGAAFSFT
jgi:hypothetical protein